MPYRAHTLAPLLCFGIWISGLSASDARDHLLPSRVRADKPGRRGVVIAHGDVVWVDFGVPRGSEPAPSCPNWVPPAASSGTPIRPVICRDRCCPKSPPGSGWSPGSDCQTLTVLRRYPVRHRRRVAGRTGRRRWNKLRQLSTISGWISSTVITGPVLRAWRYVRSSSAWGSAGVVDVEQEREAGMWLSGRYEQSPALVAG